MNLTEATILALQGKLVENKIERPSRVRRIKKEEGVAIGTDDVTVSVEDNKTEILTDKETITVVNNDIAVEPETAVEVPTEEPAVEDILPEETEEPTIDEIVDEEPVESLTESKEVKTEDVEIDVDTEDGSVEVTTTEGEEVEVKDETEEEVVEPEEEVTEETTEEEVVEEGKDCKDCDKEKVEEAVEKKEEIAPLVAGAIGVGLGSLMNGLFNKNEDEDELDITFTSTEQALKVILKAVDYIAQTNSEVEATEETEEVVEPEEVIEESINKDSFVNILSEFYNKDISIDNIVKEGKDLKITGKGLSLTLTESASKHNVIKYTLQESKEPMSIVTLLKGNELQCKFITK